MLVRLSHLVPMLKRATPQEVPAGEGFSPAFHQQFDPTHADLITAPALGASSGTLPGAPTGLLGLNTPTKEPKVDDIAGSIGADVSDDVQRGKPTDLGISNGVQVRPVKPGSSVLPLGSAGNPMTGDRVGNNPTLLGAPTGLLGSNTPTKEPKVDDIAGSIGADVNRPFAPSTPSVVGASQMPQAQSPYRQQQPAGTGVNASTVQPGVMQPSWSSTGSRLGGAGYQPHAALPSNANRFPTMGGRSFYQSDLGQPTGFETMNPIGAKHNWFGHGSNAEEAGRNLTATNTHNIHNIALGRGGVQSGTDGSSTFFNSKGEVTGSKTMGADGKPVFQSIYGVDGPLGNFGTGAGSSRPKYNVDFSRGSVTENGKPWKPATGPETPQGFAGRMAQNAPEVIPKPTAAPPTTAAASAIRKPISEISQPSPGGRWVPPSNRQPATT